MLRAQYEFSNWVLRRVEKVDFEHDLRVSRNISIDLRVPEYAPILEFEKEEHWLIPISVMRRRTLVNLDLRDEDSRSISMLGLRFTQRLDEAMLRAAALMSSDDILPPRLEKLIHDAVSGDWRAVEEAKEDFDKLKAGKKTKSFLQEAVFRAALDRTWHNFTLYVLLPVDRGRHRLLRMAFDEPVEWEYQTPNLERRTQDNDHQYLYRPFADTFGWKRHWKAMLGLEATRIRFLTPSAENCTSYHFEFTAPPGVRITRATLLAGRPNTDRDHGSSRVTLDDVEGHGPTVGLHGVEIPNGSLSRVQVDLKVPAQGWLSTLLASCVIAMLAIIPVFVHTVSAGAEPVWENQQMTNVVVLLFGVTAGAATYVAHHQATEVATRMVTGLRVVGAVAIATPAIVATMLIYLAATVARDQLGWLVGSCLLVSVVCSLVVAGAWRSARRDHRGPACTSPWDMTGVASDRREPPFEVGEQSFMDLIEVFGFNQRALGVYSAEGWHEVYAWDDRAQREALAPLSLRGNPTRCSCEDVAEHAGAVGALVPAQGSSASTNGSVRQAGARHLARVVGVVSPRTR